MQKSQISPFALFIGIVCFGVGANVAAFWSQEVWSLLESPDRSPAAERSTEAPESSAKSPPTPPTGPDRTYEEYVRGRRDDGPDELAPPYRNLPDGCGSIRARSNGEERTFPPEKTEYRIDVDGDLAAVTVEQTFRNPTERELDAVYQFPLNRRAAVFGMKMHVGERTVRAEIEKKQEAKERYERAKRRGKQAALLSQKRPNWFTQRVANIAPGDRVVVELRYVHPLPKQENAYQLVVPTMLGARYGDGGGSTNSLVLGDETSESLPNRSARLSDRSRQSGRASNVSIEVHLDGPAPIRRLHSTSHRVRLRKYAPDEWWVDLADESEANSEHFQLRFQMSGSEPRAGVHTYWDEEAEQGYFSLLLEPPRRPPETTISNREIVFVLDTSGSMQGEPLRTSKKFVKRALRSLRRKRDSFRIVEFDNNASQYAAQPVAAGEASVDRAVEYVENLPAGGGTEYGPGLETALGPETPEGSLRLVVFLTDGFIGYEFDVLRQLREQIGDARLYGIGTSRSSNRYLLEEMARMGRGFARFLQPGGDEGRMGTDERIDRAVARIESPVMTHLRIDWGTLEVDDVSPSPAPDLFAGESVRIHGTYSNPGEHEIEVHGTIGPERVTIPVNATFPETTSDGRAVELTWARRRIRHHMHELLGAKIDRTGSETEVHREAVIDLGLEHSLATQWTSFVAISESGESRGRLGSSRSVRNRSVRAGRGGVGLRGAGRGGGGQGFGRVNGLGKLSAGPGTGHGRAAGAAVSSNGPPSRSPKLVPRKPNVSGSLSKPIIKRVVRQHRREIRHCYEERLQTEPKLAGRLVVEFTISSKGDVVTASVDEKTIDDERLAQCIRQKVRAWQFPATKGGGHVRVRHPYDLSPN